MGAWRKGLALTVGVMLAAALNPAVAHAQGTTWTVEPFDLDGVGPVQFSVTEQQLGGSLCPCTKIPYVSDALHNDQGADAIANTPLKAGDTVLGFSLGSQVISLYLARHTPPPGVRFILLGDTFARNDQLLAKGQGIPYDIPNDVTLVARQYDGWSDFPTNQSSPHFGLAMQNANVGKRTIHNYRTARLDDPANVVTKRGNITAILIPTQHLPLENPRKWTPNSQANDARDAELRPLIDSAYDRPGPSPQQLADATLVQVDPS